MDRAFDTVRGWPQRGVVQTAPNLVTLALGRLQQVRQRSISQGESHNKNPARFGSLGRRS
jgi:hypothetical protein